MKIYNDNLVKAATAVLGKHYAFIGNPDFFVMEEPEIKELAGRDTKKIIALRNFYNQPVQKYTKICLNDSKKIYDFILPEYKGLDVEVSKLILLNRRLMPIKVITLNEGTESSTLVDMKKALINVARYRAGVTVLIHNHPSGNLDPSDADKEMSQKFSDVLKLIDAPLIDSIIVSEEGYYSFDNENLLNTL